MLKVYLMNGKRVDVKVDGRSNHEARAEALASEGVWTEERGETLFYPASQIIYIRVVKDKKDKPKNES